MEDLGMAVYKDEKTNTWFVSAPYRDAAGKVHVKTKRGFTLKREAMKFEQEFKQSNKELDQSEETFEDLLSKFLESKQGNANKESIHEYDRIARLFFEPILKKKLSKLKAKDMVSVKTYILSTEYSKRYKNTGIQLLKSVSRFGNTYYDLEDFAKTITKIKVTSHDLTEKTIWTTTEFDQFIEYVDNYVFKAYFTLLFRSGLRRSEGKALMKSDLNGNILTVDKSIKHNKQGAQPLKTLSSRRKVILDSHTLKLLNPLLEQPGAFLFGNHEPIGISSIQRAFTKGIQKCNEQLTAQGKPLIPVIRIHDLRHSHASLLIGQGANIVAVSKRLGHSDVNMTLKVYTHLLQEAESGMMNILESN